MDAFISWTSNDRDVKNIIVERLQAQGITCWDSDENCTSDFSAECMLAIQKCALFIVLVSDASMAKGYVKNEIIEAREREDAGQLNILVYKLTDSPYTPRFKGLLNHISFVTGNLIQRQESTGGESSLDYLIRRAQRLIERRKDGDPEKPFEVGCPKPDGLKIVPAGYFVPGSRDGILEAMEEGFRNSNVIVLREFMGFGKRSTIKKFVEQNKASCTEAFLLQSSGGTLRDFLTTELRFSNLNEKTFENLQGEAMLREKFKQLEKLDGDTIIAIADLSLAEQPEDTLCQHLRSLKCRIILLTQGAADRYGDYFPVIRVGKLDNEHLKTLFFHHYNAYEDEQAMLEAPLLRFFDQIGGHTRTVELTASVLNRELCIPPEQVPEYLSMQGTEGLQLQDRVHQQLANIFDMAKLTREEYIAMLVAACIAVPAISDRHYRTVLAACGIQDRSVLQSLDQRRWLDLDLHNRTVSIEPLLAQIVMSRSRGWENVLLQCMKHLEQLHWNGICMVSTAVGDVCNRLAHFFRLTELPLLAEVAMVMRPAYTDQGSIEPEKARELVAAFAREYPDTAYGEEPENTEVCTREDFVYEAQCFVRNHLLPGLKLMQLGKADLLVDYSAGSDRFAAMTLPQKLNLVDLEADLGISMEEFCQWAESLRQQMESTPYLEPDDPEAYLLAEAYTCFYAYIRRDGSTLQLGVNRLLQLLELVPQLAEETEEQELIYLPLLLVAVIYYRSGALSAAATICEKALALGGESVYHTWLRRTYIQSLRDKGQFPPVIFDLYRRVLTDLEQGAGDAFADHTVIYSQKKEILLAYAEALARTGSPEEAGVQFAAAQKLGALLLPDSVICVANNIVESFIQTGRFEQVPVFLKEHFSTTQQLQLRQVVSEENAQTLDVFSDYLRFENIDSDFVQNGDFVHSASYYQSYARKNDSFLERKYIAIADKAMEYDFRDLSNQEIMARTELLRNRARREPAQRLMAEAFALCSEAGFRVLGYRHHHVQFMGAAAMADGQIAEILNGEGKTYTIVLTAFLMSLYGRVYVVDQSEYLTQRNQNWMQGVYELLGVTCQHVPDVEALQHSRGQVQYLTLKNLVLGYLKIETAEHDLVKLNTDCVIIDEADTVLVDCAQQRYSSVAWRQTPELLRWHEIAWELAQTYGFDDDCVQYDGNSVILRSALTPIMEEYYGICWSDLTRLTQVRRIEQIQRTALLCSCVYEKDKDYFIYRQQPVWEDGNTGSFTPMQASYRYFLCRLNDLDTTGAAQELAAEGEVINIICLRDMFRKFRHLCGTTATAVSFQKEFKELYGLGYVAVPPHLPSKRTNIQSPVYLTAHAKERAILDTVREKHRTGQPVLLVTQSIRESEKYDRLLRREGIEHQLLNARNAEDSSHMLAQAGVPGSVLVANALASRGVDIKLGGNPELLTRRELASIGADLSQLDSFLYRLPTPEIEEMPLYRQYYSILEKYRRLTAADRQTAQEAGGLCVIGTSFFPEPRNEQQTRGRSGRQGNVGESIIFVSLEDETLGTLLTPSYLEWVRSFAGDLESMDGKIIDKALKNGQKTLHHVSFARIRSTNDIMQHIDRARGTFLDPRFELEERRRTVDELLEQWLSQKHVLQKQQNMDGCLWMQQLAKRDERLMRARGPMALKLLLTAYRQLLAENLKTEDYNQNTELIRMLSGKLKELWIGYIAVVLDTEKLCNTKPQVIEKLLQEEKDKRMLQLLDWILRLKKRKGE